jgi:hypothetical protein
VRLESADSPKAGANVGSLPPLSTDAVRAVLASIKLTGPDGAADFLNDSQLSAISEPVSRAMRAAMPGQDVTFGVHVPSTGSFFALVGPPRMTAGRIWLENDSVGVIIGMVNATYLANAVTVDRSMIRTGSRLGAQETTYRIVPGGAVSLAQANRSDWARISPVAWTGTYGMPVAPAAAAQPPQPAMMPEPSTPSAALSAPVPRDPMQIEQRFATLKRLLDNHMISEQDYQHAKDDLLKAMTTIPNR